MARDAARHANPYANLHNDPAVLEKRAKEQAELDAAMKSMLAAMPGRVPAWERRRVLHIDRYCLEEGKRCIMWDDDGAGFYLMMNWDWLRNRPAQPPEGEEATGYGWWANFKQMFRLPLLDDTVPDDALAAWVDKHTMAVHHHFLGKLGKLRHDAASGKVWLDDPYWQELQELPRADWEAAGTAGPGGRAKSDGGKGTAVGEHAAAAAPLAWSSNVLAQESQD